MTDRGHIRIGNQTAYSAGRAALPFEFAVDRGFDAFEWFPDKKESGEGWTVHDIPGEARLSIRETARTHDIRLSVHAPWPSNALNREAETPLRETIEFARDIGAALFNIHLQTERGIPAYLEAVRPVLRLLDDAGIGLAVENTVYTSPDDFTDFFRYLRESGEEGASRAGMCLDLGHANLFRETRNDYLRFIDMLPPEVPIVHVHLHENYGDRDDHLPIFTGPAGRDASGIRGFVERLKKRNFSGCIILEQWPSPEDLLVEARNRLIEIIGMKPESPRTAGIDYDGEDIVGKFAEANGRFLSWRKRLDWVLHLLAAAGERPGLDLLTYIAVYLRFIGTGEIRCGEDGGHYRPSHHAAISERIYRRLVKLETPENFFVIRKIYPWLPSFDSEFKRAEPLTLIRDIAHRNDIPRELKQEIKTTLQNKLHRSAGPEDLAVSEALLKRITAPEASYPEAFVSEFKRFHEELKDFFNAGSLKELLIRTIERKEFEDVSLLRRFLVVLEHPGKDRDALKALELLTGIRIRLGPKIRTDTGAAGHRLQLVDIRLEDYAFVLLSRLLNYLDHGMKDPWKILADALHLAVSNIRLSGFEPGECAAIEAELRSVSSVFDPARRDRLLRLKASAERCMRLAATYRDKALTLFPEKAQMLGRALGVEEQAVRVYAEADIRRHPVFQLSKLVSLLLNTIRESASLPLWDVIVPGNSQGRLLTGRSLSSLPAAYDGPVIALVDHAEGEEEIPAYVTGIVVTTDTPLLSHLAVRARQRRTVFISCGDAERIEKIKTFSGKSVSLVADSSDFLVSPAEFEGSADPEVPCAETSVAVGPPVEYPEETIIAMDLVTPSVGGGKAYGARRLGEIAEMDGAGFMVPKGLVLPFGIMETSLNSSSALAEEYASLAGEIDRVPLSGKDARLGRLREIILQLALPDEVISGITAHFRKDRMLMVRSSSNCEDAEGLAGAGLYDSVANVPISGTAPAIRRVWASLWNRRALNARRNAGISHEHCRMAVLIQTMLSPDLSFIMHTANPVSGNEEEMLVELAVGLGETIASGRQRGTAFRMICHKKEGNIELLSFANYSFALRAGSSGASVMERVDYSGIPFSCDDDFRERLGRRIGETGRFVESVLGRPQDIEGLVKGEEIYLVQARPQQILHCAGRNECPS
jgi:phosphoglucan,water dikinase